MLIIYYKFNLSIPAQAHGESLTLRCLLRTNDGSLQTDECTNKHHYDCVNSRLINVNLYIVFIDRVIIVVLYIIVIVK